MRILLVLLAVYGVFAVCPHQRTDLTPFSTLFPNFAGGDVTISSTQKVLLNQNYANVNFGVVSIFGTLVFADMDMEIKAQHIAVETGGILFVGSDECPIQSHITFTMLGDWADPQTSALVGTGMGTKCISADTDAQVDIHGVVRHPTWTFLDATAAAGATQLRLAQTVQWIAGDRIVVSSTDYERNRPQCWDEVSCDWTEMGNQTQSEVRTIVSVTEMMGYSVVEIDRPLRFVHWGETWVSPNGQDRVDTRGEVALLTRNIVVRGDLSGNSYDKRFGSHMKFDGANFVHLTGVETYHAGQSLVLGRYPIHFHLASNQPGSYVRHCSIHDTFQRALTIHWTNMLEVYGNVAYNSTGHMFFFEDGIETSNNVTWNIGIHARPHTLLGSDDRPAIFWVTYPNNDFSYNVAVGGTFGWWFSMPEHPVQLALGYEPWNYWGRFQKQGRHYRNTAHGSFETGLFYDEGIFDATGTPQGLTSYTPRDWQTVFDAASLQSIYTADQTRAKDIVFNSPYHPALVEGFTAWKCRNFGVWYRGDHMHLVSPRLADNRIGILMPGQANLVEDAVIVGESSNVGTIMPVFYRGPGYEVRYTYAGNGRSRPVDYDPWATIKGYSFYDAGGPDIVINARIYNLVDATWLDDSVPAVSKTRMSGGVGGLTGPNALEPIGLLFNMHFTNVGNTVLHENNDLDDGSIGLAIPDRDGTLLGTCGKWAVSEYGPHLWDSQCTHRSSWHMYECPASYQYLAFSFSESTNALECSLSVALVYPQLACSDRSITLPVPANISDDPASAGYAVFLQFKATLLQYTGRLTRLRDRATVTINPDLKTYPTYVNLGYNYANNFKVGEEYLFTYPSINNGAPEDLWLSLYVGEPGMWSIFAVPYPPGTQIVYVGSGYDGSDNATAAVVASRAALVASPTSAWYWDNAAGVLWMKFVFVETQYDWNGSPYRYYYKLPVPDVGLYAHVYVACPNHNCSYPSFDPSSVTAFPTLPTTTFPTSCLASRSVPSFMATGAAPIWSQAANYAFGWSELTWTDVHFTVEGHLPWTTIGSAGTGTGGGWAAWGIHSDPGLSTTGFTHLHIRLHCLAPNGDCYPGIYAQDVNYNDILGPVAMNHPRYITNGPLTDGGMQDVYIPLVDLGVTGTLHGLIMVPATLWDQTRPYTLVVERIELATVEVTNTAAGIKQSSGTYTGPAWSGLHALPDPLNQIPDSTTLLGSSSSVVEDSAAVVSAMLAFLLQ